MHILSMNSLWKFGYQLFMHDIIHIWFESILCVRVMVFDIFKFQFWQFTDEHALTDVRYIHTYIESFNILSGA